MIRLLFTVPYTGTEILTFIAASHTSGITYDPLSTRTPLTWTSDCPRCRLGKNKLPLKIRRYVQSLCSATPLNNEKFNSGYRLHVSTNDKTTYDVVAEKDDDWLLRVTKKTGSEKLHLLVEGKQGRVSSTDGPAREFRSPILERTIKMLLSARVLSENSDHLSWNERSRCCCQPMCYLKIKMRNAKNERNSHVETQ